MPTGSKEICPECFEQLLGVARFVPKSVERWIRNHAQELGYSHEAKEWNILEQLEKDEDLRRQMPARTRRQFDLWKKRGGNPRGVVTKPLSTKPCPRHGRTFRAGVP